MSPNSYRTEFFETAAKLGFYGLERGGLAGKKDNVRKYWEDTTIKLLLRPAIERLLQGKPQLRVVDVGCGSGEGFELLTHIPCPEKAHPPYQGFLLWRGSIEAYMGLDISPGMLEQGRRNYPDVPEIQFIPHDLSKGFPLLSEPPFDLYFSSYSPLSHLTASQLEVLTEQIFGHVQDRGYVLFDMLGRFSPEWPGYWQRSAREMLDYNMAYLLPPEQQATGVFESYRVAFWSPAELADVLERAARRAGRKIRLEMRDRSILVGRHMDTGLFNGTRMQVRYQVNRLFERSYSPDLSQLRVALPFLPEAGASPPGVVDRIEGYCAAWNVVVDLLEALIRSDVPKVRFLIETSRPELSEELKMLTWLYRSADRFPVMDFWASIMAPQVACVLRNLEYSLPSALGCGHGLLCLAEVTRD